MECYKVINACPTPTGFFLLHVDSDFINIFCSMTFKQIYCINIITTKPNIAGKFHRMYSTFGYSVQCIFVTSVTGEGEGGIKPKCTL